jgi:hypothetical protein
LLQDVIRFAYKVEKKIFNRKLMLRNTPTQSNPLHEECTLMLLICRFNQKFPDKIKAHYVNTEEQTADTLTKTLARPLFERFKQRLGLI